MFVSTVTPPDGISRRIEIEGEDAASAMKNLRAQFPKGTCSLPRPLIPHTEAAPEVLHERRDGRFGL
jgi:hypothetical protein